MSEKPRFKRMALIAITVVFGIAAGMFFWRVAAHAQEWQWRISGKLIDYPSYLIYLPDGYLPGKPYPLVFALSPSADALSMISVWSPVADRHGWLVAASKEFHNGVEWDLLLPQIEAELNEVEKNYTVEPSRVIFTGLSGGGMGAHAISKFFPNRVTAIVINTGMMEESFMTADYPERKWAVFLASPTDFRYQEMQRDRKFLELHRWKAKWIEFSGGHMLAPLPVYEQAAEWLEDNLPK
jgi:poly(3-hydroxybutyrate) depolymerase